jgi:hypothetical protein
MSLDFTGLSDLAADTKRHTKQGWQPLTPDDLGHGRVLAFDQSLTATGWVKVIRGYDGVLVVGAGKVRDLYSGEKNSIETQLRRGVEVFEQAYVLIDEATHAGYSVIHESPPNPAAVKGGGYGSLLAAQSVRNAAALAQTTIEQLGAQPAKTLICGSAKAQKPEAHAALKDCFPWIEGSHLITNEAHRDALLIALLWLRRKK